MTSLVHRVYLWASIGSQALVLNLVSVTMLLNKVTVTAHFASLSFGDRSLCLLSAISILPWGFAHNGKWDKNKSPVSYWRFLWIPVVMEDIVICLCLLGLPQNFPNLLTEVCVWLALWPTEQKTTNYLYRTLIEGLCTIESVSQLESCLGSNVLSKNHDIHSSINRWKTCDH